ncbi:hypothetical protein MYAER_2763 [Microcystis aeruginosa NIES-2549]|uniref:Uncharacterized protein n=1 Tax=Microcystis aeruginosa NIES-2549 TaxID=1641812 RepID=A0A0F6RMB2_MICAE|nr:hypothetical protein MYAER_2763 [Microcystis aeruginosa NIES-2549]AOC53508.1 hypothetical protein amyaer_2799 [Microcystis aeruginosa NIES-2481]
MQSKSSPLLVSIRLLVRVCWSDWLKICFFGGKPPKISHLNPSLA